MIFGELLKYERERHGLTQWQLHQETGVAYASIQKYEQLKYGPALDNALVLAKYLGFSLDTLMDEVAVGPKHDPNQLELGLS